ncbi:glutathione S-transferase family protein [Candidatus Uabimicrobium amorphum]|uniref:Glutathione S-transferase n=1 Tax=Uabimicrobium amorphum TaxID=2596890 RepID=A0A5S9IJE9_UABAM|nr:glutathione S-transferase family protein [Candidatus Uabimicrobium amorphum]BBM82160.1 glutathione S-transferase [Candidatus Uabimicrobium amorphum]
MLELYGFDYSRSHRGMWALEEAGAEYRYTNLDFTKGEHKSVEFLAKNPGGKVPVLIDGDLALAESAAIVTYIGDKFAEKNLVPKAGTKERALYGQWIAFVISELEQPLWMMGRHKFIYPEEKRIPQVLDLAVWEFSSQIKVLDEGLADNEYIVGNHFTMADIMVVHTIMWAQKFQVPIESDKLVKYAERLKEREAHARVIAKYEENKKE